MSDLELTMMRRVGELNKENARLKAEVERLTACGYHRNFDFSVEHLTRLFKDGKIAEVSYEGERSQWYCADAYARCVNAEIEAKRLKADVEAVRQEYSDATNHYNRLHNDLQAQVERVGAENAHLHKGIYSMSLNVAQLKDEVERLTKAGDAMAEEIALAKRQDEGSRFDPIEMHYDHELIVKWNAAKEGKQP